MDTPVIVAALRTPLGSFQGGLKHCMAPELAGILTRELLHRTGVPPEDIEEVVMGNVLGAGLGQNPSRQAAVFAGIPYSSSAVTLDMVCGSGLRSVCAAAQSVTLGDYSAVIAGGTENMSRAPQLMLRDDRRYRTVSSVKYDGLRCAFRKVPMGDFAEAFAREYRISRREQDEFALASHRRTSTSVDGGLFDAEIVPVPSPGGSNGFVARDECPRRYCTLESLSLLKPSFAKDGTVTAGNATPLADGAAAVMVTSESYAASRRLTPLARIVSWCTAGVEPQNVFLATVGAVRKLLKKTGLTVDDIDVFEINDSFAVQAILCRRELTLDSQKVNLRGGTLALGHPLGASGARILVTLLHILQDERKRLGLATICLGGGNAVAMLVETLQPKV
jgi:acetyl-CoA C-acetyltransferase